MSDEELHAYFWQLAENIINPLVEEARTHTTPSIERSVLLRMGFSSIEAKGLVEKMNGNGILGRGAGRLVLEVAKTKGISVREAGEALLADQHWELLPS
jgi:D-ornithine 4,5-aminomutase subunit alpha